MKEPLELTDLQRLLEARRWQEARELAAEIPAPELAESLQEMHKSDRVLVFRLLPRELAANVFSYLDAGERDALLVDLTDDETRQLLANLPPDDRTELLAELPGNVTRRLLNLLSPEDRREASTLLGYPENSVGRLMTPAYVSVRPEWTASDALRHIRQFGRKSETIDQLYVIRRTGELIGQVDLRGVLLADPSAKIEDLMDEQVLSITADRDREDAVRLVEQYDRNVLAVVSTEGVLLGIVTVDDILDVAEQEATEDIQKMGGMEALEAPYLDVSFASMVRKRGGWLSALFLGEMLTATAMSYFEQEIAAAVVLALFIPLIISSGGNSGSQAASLMIRSLALEDVRLRDWWIVFRRELASGIALGTLLGAIGFLRVVLWQNLRLTDYGPHYLLVATTIFLSLIGVVLFGTMTGSMLPFLMRRLGFDPAASSAPFVATLVDVTGLVIYFSIAHMVLSRTLLP
ncbi:MAG TPA: magnesium transporter [Clostridia bacterium]|nr:magnesium transporter [Clostridia bacterium]